MSEPKMESFSFESRIERAESMVELLRLVSETMSSEGYIKRQEGGENISKANRAGIAKFGRRAYFTAFDEKFGPGMAEQYMRPPEDNE